MQKQIDKNMQDILNKLKLSFNKAIILHKPQSNQENFNEAISFIHEILTTNPTPTINKDPIFMWINPKYKQHEKALSDIFNLYYDVYKNSKTLTEFTQRDIEQRSLHRFKQDDKEPGYGNIQEDYRKSMKLLFDDRKKSISNCENDNPFYKGLKEGKFEVIWDGENKEFAEYDPIDDTDGELKKACNNTIWGETYLKPPETICDISKDELMLGTIKDDINENTTLRDEDKQVVFGFGTSIEKYKKCRRLFRAGKMQKADPKKPMCNLLEWSPKLNLLFTLCASYTNAKYNRFILGEGMITPFKKRFYHESDDIYQENLVAIMRIKFSDDRVGQHHPTCIGTSDCYLTYFIFYGETGGREYWHEEFNKYHIYSANGSFISIKQLFGYTNVTYNEFNQIICYLKLKMYRSIDHPNILFFPNRDINGKQRIPSSEEIQKLKLVETTYECKEYITKTAEGKEIPKKYIVRYENDKAVVDKLRNNDENYIWYSPKKKDYLISVGDLPYELRQRGGSEFKLVWSSKYEFYTPDIATLSYKSFIKKILEYRQMFKTDPKLSKKSSTTESFLLNSYEFVYPQKLTVKMKSREVVFQQGKIKRRHLIREMIDPSKPSFSIIKYKPLNNKFFENHEIIYNFKLINNKSKILEVSSNTFSFIEASNYYLQGGNFNALYYDKYANKSLKLGDNYLDYTKQFMKIESKIIKEYVDVKQLQLESKYDTIATSLYNIHSRIDYSGLDSQIYNYILNLFSLALIINNLKPGGNAVIEIGSVTTKRYADIVVIAKQAFDKVELYNCEITNKYKFVGVYIVCQKFNSNIDGLKEMISNLLKTYPTGLMDTPNSIYNFEKMQITGEDKKELCSILSYESDNKIYNFIRRFNKITYYDKYLYMLRLIDTIKNSENHRDEQVINSIVYAKKYGFEYMEEYSKDFGNEIGKLIMADMYSYHQEIKFTFKHYDDNKISFPYDEFQKIQKKISMMEFLIDTRDANKWYKVKMMFRYYAPSDYKSKIAEYVKEHYNTGKISQAWMKMYEIIKVFSLIPVKDTFKTFHLCEAPGNFISAINHYIKTETKIKNFDWMAQSLNPWKGKGIIGDDYGYIRKYPKRWTFGQNNTGDITTKDNLEYYKQYCQNVDLITSDCGLPMEEDFDPLPLVKVHFAQLLYILYLLPKNASFVAKLMNPQIYPIQISMLYMIYNCFEKMSFFKGVINVHSKEFYLIGENYQNPISDDMKRKLIKLLGDFDMNTNLYDTYDTGFIIQLQTITKTLTDKYVFNFNRQLFYVDNYELLDKTHIDTVKKIIYEKNVDLVKRLGLKMINSSDRL